MFHFFGGPTLESAFPSFPGGATSTSSVNLPSAGVVAKTGFGTAAGAIAAGWAGAASATGRKAAKPQENPTSKFLVLEVPTGLSFGELHVEMGEAMTGQHVDRAASVSVGGGLTGLPRCTIFWLTG